jgi:4-amino-4-deoxy-L-arabinose transferase-like glycosyltransferase
MDSKLQSQQHLILFLFVIFCFTKLTLIKQIPLINDEAYTLTISRYFSLSYFDHPPLMMWISYFFHLFEISPLDSYRLPYIFFGLLTSFFLFQVGSLIYSKEAGIVAALLYFVSPFFFFSGGFFVLPDASLNLAVAGATYIAIKIIFNGHDSRMMWVILGALLSIAFLSKYQSYIFGIALFASFLVWKKDTIFSINFLIALLVSICGLLPVLMWNIENNFDSFRFHQNRSSFNFDIFHILNSIFSQLLLLLPTTGALIIFSLSKPIRCYLKKECFLLVLALPTIIIFNIFILLSDSSFSHWSMMGWMLLLPMAANSLVSLKSLKFHVVGLKVLNVFVVFSLIFTVSLHAKTGFLTKNYSEKLPPWDDTRELLDWKTISYILEKNLAKNNLNSIATLSWYDSGQLSSAFNYRYLVGVLGKNSNHFKYIGLSNKNFTTLIDVQLINNPNKTNLNEKIHTLGYRIKNQLDLPFLRGSEQYGIISILSIEKVH